MCGIVGLFIKNPELRPQLGHHLTTMLIGMTDRGPDSSGIAIYRGEEAEHEGAAGGGYGSPCSTRPHSTRWREVAATSPRRSASRPTWWSRTTTPWSPSLGARTATAGPGSRPSHPEVRVMGYGRSMEVYKDMGLPADVAGRFGVATMTGTHGIGHTRMATESAVTTEHSHPFTAGVRYLPGP